MLHAFKLTIGAGIWMRALATYKLQWWCGESFFFKNSSPNCRQLNKPRTPCKPQWPYSTTFLTPLQMFSQMHILSTTQSVSSSKRGLYVKSKLADKEFNQSQGIPPFTTMMTSDLLQEVVKLKRQRHVRRLKGCLREEYLVLKPWRKLNLPP